MWGEVGVPAWRWQEAQILAHRLCPIQLYALQGLVVQQDDGVSDLAFKPFGR